MSGHAIRRCGQFPRYAETVRIPLVPRSSVQTLLRSTALRGVIRAFQQTAPASLTASSLICLDRSKPLRFHSVTHLVPVAGLSRSNLGDVIPLLDCQCKLPEDLPTSPQPSTAGRLPRPTALPARDFSHCGFTADAVKPPFQKPPSPPTLTHAPRSCRKSSTSHARPNASGI